MYKVGKERQKRPSERLAVRLSRDDEKIQVQTKRSAEA